VEKQSVLLTLEIYYNIAIILFVSNVKWK
jgi:hypothetical protein